jgi:hypothetical protein
MAFTERYVTSAAGGGGDGSSGSPWTLAEAFANAVAGDRVNIQSDSAYSTGSVTLTNAGTAASAIVYRGYDVTIGDLEGQGRNADGTLNTTGFPVINSTGGITGKNFNHFESLNISAAVFGPAVVSSNNFSLLACNVVNSNNHSSVTCFQGNQSDKLINCDFECTGAARSDVVRLTNSFGYTVYGCRLKGAGASDISPLLNANNGAIVNNVFIGNGSDIGIQFAFSSSGRAYCISGNTFYNLATGITLPNAAQTNTLAFINNHITDCGKWIDNLYSGTSNIYVLEINNRTRDNTTPRTGIGDGVNVSEVTEDTGDKDTDYVDADNDDLHLIAAAPAIGAGLIEGQDIGAYQFIDVPVAGEDETTQMIALGTGGSFPDYPDQSEVTAGIQFANDALLGEAVGGGGVGQLVDGGLVG